MSLIDTAESGPQRSHVNTPSKIMIGITAAKTSDKRDVFFKTQYFSGWFLLNSMLVGLTFFGVAIAFGTAEESIRGGGLTSDLVGKTRLTSTEITRLFSDVLDRGEVQNQQGISAETRLHADGTFVSR